MSELLSTAVEAKRIYEMWMQDKELLAQKGREIAELKKAKEITALQKVEIAMKNENLLKQLAAQSRLMEEANKIIDCIAHFECDSVCEEYPCGFEGCGRCRSLQERAREYLAKLSEDVRK